MREKNARIQRLESGLRQAVSYLRQYHDATATHPIVTATFLTDLQDILDDKPTK